MPTTAQHLIETPVPGLLATPPAQLPFAAGLDVRSFVLGRAGGNVAVDDAPGLDAVAGDLEARGGVTRWLVSHEHEAALGPATVGVGATLEIDAVAARVRAGGSR